MKKIFKIFTIILFMFLLTDTVSAEEVVLKTVSCGRTSDIPAALPILTSNLIDLLKIATPIILIIMGMIDFFRATMSGDDKSMNESKSRFIKRTISGVIVFLIISVVELSFSILNNHDGIGSKVSSCLDCFINNDCREVKVTSCNDYKDKESCDGAVVGNWECRWAVSAGTNKKYCSSYKLAKKYCHQYDSTCPEKDDYGNECTVVSDSGGRYCKIVNKKYCHQYDSTCPEKDDYGNECTPVTDSGGRYCTRVTKYCTDYTTEESCPSTDDHGNTCKWSSEQGGRPQCLIESTGNEPVAFSCWTCASGNEWSVISPGLNCEKNNLTQSQCEGQSSTNNIPSCWSCNGIYEWSTTSPIVGCTKTELTEQQCNNSSNNTSTSYCWTCASGNVWSSINPGMGPMACTKNNLSQAECK